MLHCVMGNLATFLPYQHHESDIVPRASRSEVKVKDLICKLILVNMLLGHLEVCFKTADWLC